MTTIKQHGMAFWKWFLLIVLAGGLVMIFLGPVEANVNDVEYVGNYPLAIRTGLVLIVGSLALGLAYSLGRGTKK